MYAAQHDELLEYTVFNHPEEEERPAFELQAVEMWKYARIETCTEENFRHIALKDSQVESWLAGNGEFAPPNPPNFGAVLEGGIRLLFCQRSSYRPPGFSMSRASFLAVERAFKLPLNTLDAVFQYQGTFSKTFTYPSSDDSGNLERISLVIKAAQKMPISNYLLAFSHDISTGMSTALIHGSFLHTPLPRMKNSLLENPVGDTSDRRHRDYHRFQVPLEPGITQSSQIITYLRRSISQWANPMLLPIAILDNYISRSNLFAHDLDDQVVVLERQTGVVFAGRNVRLQELSIQPEQLPRESIRSLTQDMHTLLAEIIFYERVTEWTYDYTKFLAKVIDELNRSSWPDSRIALLGKMREMTEAVEYYQASSKSMCGFQRGLKERVQSQINVLYSFIAQIDNSINARIAVSSARDSSAMKTLALLTTVFLPGTYIATLFSMSMFDWSQSSAQDDGSETVSKRFWVYWAVTVPLTILVMVVWRVWWLWQERVYQKEVKEAVGKVDEDDASSFEQYSHIRDEIIMPPPQASARHLP